MDIRYVYWSSTPLKMCEPCSLRKRTERAVYFCRSCFERYCESCYLIHKAHKSSSNHDIVTFDETIQNINECEPCSFGNKSTKSTQFCRDCKEYLCEHCTTSHRSHKQNKNHTTIQINEALNCNPCKMKGKTETAVKFCLDCKEPDPLCASSADIHLSMKRTRGHRMSSDMSSLINNVRQDPHQETRNSEVCLPKITRTPNISNVEIQPNVTSKTCEPCYHRDRKSPASYYCQDCDEQYCENCKQKHTKREQTQNHNVVAINRESSNCMPCTLYNVVINATNFCKVCNKDLCNECTKTHLLHKITRKHKIRPLQPISPSCEICDTADATLYCDDCEDPELLCELCADVHRSMKQNRTHKLSNDLTKFLSRLKPTKSTEKTEFIISHNAFEKPSVKKILENPEKPYVIEENSKFDHINLKWEHNKKLSDEELYQINFKSAPNGEWKVFSPTKPCRSRMIVIDGLEAETSYIFKVRVTNKDTGNKGPFSHESEIIKTGISPALQIKQFSKKIATGPPDVYMLPITENKAARNETSQTRKFTLGSPGSHTQEKTIMIVGATGSGKSTLINNMANYVMGVTWEDPFRFTLVNLETCEQARKGNEALSQTEWITCYTIYNDVSRLNYTINLIDTPGFGDTRGLTQDARIVSQIKQLFTAKNVKGLTVLDAVCFILKAPDARLTSTQTYIFESILTLFGKDITDNICTLITFADGQRPPVLAGLEALPGKPLPYKVYFPFNNSALFVNNTKQDPTKRSSFFWDMGMLSSKLFFQKIMSLQTKSLLLTSEVLRKRQQLETIILHLQEEIDNGLTKIDSLEGEVKIFTMYQSQIDHDKDFEYLFKETDTVRQDISGTGIHTTYCLVCNMTCHKNCTIANNTEKAKCCIISHQGLCKVCPKKCDWRDHYNVPFIVEYQTKWVTKTYSNKLAQYRKASQKNMTKAQLVQKMKEDIKSCKKKVQGMIEEITIHTNRLKDIALRSNPISTVAYIELMIESEKLERKSGYKQRLQTLNDCKKRAEFENRKCQGEI